MAPKEFGAFAGQVRDICDPDAADRRHRKQQRESWLSVSKTIDDLVSVQGMLSAEHGELLLTALAALMPPPDADDPRSASQRRAGALADLCRLAANTAPVAGGEKPHLIVTMSLETLRGKLNNTDTDHSNTDPATATANNPATTTASHPATATTTASSPATAAGDYPTGAGPGRSEPAGVRVDSGAKLGSGMTIGAETARRLACDCSIIPVVLGGASEPLDLGRARRLVSPAQRRALIIRDAGGCTARLPPTALTNCDNVLGNRRWRRAGSSASR